MDSDEMIFHQKRKLQNCPHKITFDFQEGVLPVDQANTYMEYIVNLIDKKDKEIQIQRIFIPFLDDDDESRLLYIALSIYSSINNMIEFLLPPYSEKIEWVNLENFYNASYWNKWELVDALQVTAKHDLFVSQNYLGQQQMEDSVLPIFSNIDIETIRFILKELYNIESKGEIDE